MLVKISCALSFALKAGFPLDDLLRVKRIFQAKACAVLIPTCVAFSLSPFLSAKSEFERFLLFRRRKTSLRVKKFNRWKPA